MTQDTHTSPKLGDAPKKPDGQAPASPPTAQQVAPSGVINPTQALVDVLVAEKRQLADELSQTKALLIVANSRLAAFQQAADAVVGEDAGEAPEPSVNGTENTKSAPRPTRTRKKA